MHFGSGFLTVSHFAAAGSVVVVDEPSYKILDPPPELVVVDVVVAGGAGQSLDEVQVISKSVEQTLTSFLCSGSHNKF